MFVVATAVVLVFITVISTIFGAIIPSLPLAILASIAISAGAYRIFGHSMGKTLTAEETETIDEILFKADRK